MSSSDLSLSRASRLRFAAIGGGVMAAAVLAAVTAATPADPPSREYVAVFDRAGQGLDDKSKVKVRGMPVGAVLGVSLDPRGRAVVRFRVEKSVRLPASVSASVEPLSVFGPKDLALDLGQGEGVGPYLPDGAAVARTTAPADLADSSEKITALTEAIDPEDLATLLHTFAAALRGNGTRLRATTEGFAKIVDTLHDDRSTIARTLRDTAVVTDVLGRNADALGQIIEGADALGEALTADPDAFATTLANTRTVAAVLTGVLDRHGGDLGDLVDALSRITHTLYPNQDELGETVEGLNEFFRGLTDILYLPGPKGTRMGAVNMYLGGGPCEIFEGSCPPGANGGRR
ncbi:MCE family protein [Actinocorallia sp. API 0066]|uniref:MCE family protein n=1 Tax=Actinocorallia sp. API 0066 TaxID=2896846 RepID=UPI001E54514E|nr:MCE family protein [Actinocorallia sp. API 0066]MCD0451443.1 MCE family protein [Actinocorallia sp. API 0066]